MKYAIKDKNIEYSCAQYSGRLPFAIKPESIGKSELSYVDAGVVYLRSPYFKAAIDRFGIFLKRDGIRESFGYLFPVSLLDKANEQEYENIKEWQMDMIYIGYKKLLDFCHENNRLYQDGDVVETLDEIGFGDDVFMLIYDKNIETDETMFVPALYEKGFYVAPNPYVKTNLYTSSYMKRVIAGEGHHQDLTLIETTESFVKFGFVKDLYMNLLPYIESSAFRYILLYQVIEYLIDLKKNETWFNSMNTFSAKHSNELIHKLMETGKEESLINMVFIGWKRRDVIYQEFVDYAKQLYDGVKKEWTVDTDFPAYMYGVRNILVHNLKEAIEYGDIINELAERYERIITAMIMKVKIDDCAGKGVFVYDMNQRYLENKRAFSKLFHEN